MLREITGEYDGEYLIPERSNEDTIMLYGNKDYEMLNLVIAGSRGKLWQSVTIDRTADYCHLYIGTAQIEPTDKFMDRVIELYPALWEWLLFHPEWLRNMSE